MGYYVKRCAVCNQEIHLHKKGSHFILKGACQHIPKEKVTNCKDSDSKQLFKNYQYGE